MEVRFQIDKDVALPVERQNYNKGKYPVDEMEVGDSFLVPLQGGYSASDQARLVRNAVHHHIKRREGDTRKFTTRVRSTGIRCWRIA